MSELDRQGEGQRRRKGEKWDRNVLSAPPIVTFSSISSISRAMRGELMSRVRECRFASTWRAWSALPTL